MTDNTPMVPTEDELMELGHECELDAVAFGRAVLAKWGTPAPVGAEPVARLEIWKTKGGVSLTHIAEPAAFQLPEGMYALYTTPQHPPAALVAAKEREECAQVCESRVTPGTGSVAILGGAADAIRAKGKP